MGTMTVWTSLTRSTALVPARALWNAEVDSASLAPSSVMGTKTVRTGVTRRTAVTVRHRVLEEIGVALTVPVSNPVLVALCVTQTAA